MVVPCKTTSEKWGIAYKYYYDNLYWRERKNKRRDLKVRFHPLFFFFFFFWGRVVELRDPAGINI
jgi:hypothetical protein